jgi:lipoprotein-releasing system ATP-binding protein
MTDSILELCGVTKEYGSEAVTQVLRGVDLSIGAREFAAISGPSGSGKSTLLNILGLLDRPSSGTVRVLGTDTTGMSDAELTSARGQKLGFIFQFHHLLPSLTALENVMLPLAIETGRTSRESESQARELLHRVGVGHRMGAKPTQMSGGQQQRVAIARALIHRPKLVLADEPTGSLDSSTAWEVFSLLRTVHEREGTSFVIVTHDPAIAARCDRHIRVVDGRIAVENGAPP